MATHLPWVSWLATRSIYAGVAARTGRYTDQRHLVGEAVSRFGRGEDGRVNAEDGEAVLVVAAGILDEDDPAGTDRRLGCLGAFLLEASEVAGGVDERVERLGRYLQRIAGFDLLHRAHQASVPSVQSGFSTASGLTADADERR